MSKFIDLTGQKYGRLLVLERVNNMPKERAKWLCKCDCGRALVVSSHSLRTGNTQSCGCLQRERAANSLQKTATTHGARKTRLYQTWLNMRKRCNDPKCKSYPVYGGRGIKVCVEWESSFTCFRDWALSSGYSDDLTIDRIDNDQGYSPDNCRWIPKSEQSKNRRPWGKKDKH